MRVFTGLLATETNTFSPMPTGLDAFRRRGAYFPAGQHPQEASSFSAPLLACRDRAAKNGWTLIEGSHAFAQPSGPVTAPAWETLREELLDGLRAAVPVDMVILGLHGAMVAEDCDDCEGAILKAVREIVGTKTVVGAVLDPHCHMTPMMRDHADLMITFKEYPHDDMPERSYEAVDLCARMVAGEIRPTVALHDLAMVWPVFTTREPGISILKLMHEMETRPGVLSVWLAQGFPWADVPEMGSRTLVYTDNDPALAEALARELGDFVYARRETLREHQPAPDAALDRALSAPASRPVVIADGADNAGGGAGSDSTVFLRRILERGIDNVALGPMWDPVAVQFAFDAGIGARVALRIGGKVGPASGQPLDALCRVKALRRDMTMTAFGQTQYKMGDCALIDIDGVEVVLTSIRSQALNIDLFTNLGCDLTSKRIIAVKSTQHFYTSFAPLAQEVIYVDTPGSVTLDLNALPYARIRKPKWPLRD